MATQEGDKRRVLILCTGNSCRSQMAEGLVNHFLSDAWEARSAGTDPADRVHPLAVAAMAEIGIDITGGKPEGLAQYLQEPWDLVFTVCDNARDSCPVFPRPVAQQHISFDDPARIDGTGEEKRKVFRRVRDEIRQQLVEAVRARG